MKHLMKFLAVAAAVAGLTACHGGQKGQGACCKDGEKAECCQKADVACCQKAEGACCQKAESGCCQKAGEDCCKEAKPACCKEGKGDASCQAHKAMCPSAAFDQIVATRRSVRSYDGTKTITKEQVCEVLAAAQEAPSWINYEPTKYYVAMSPDKIAAVKEAVGRNKDRLDGVSALIVSTFEKGKSGFVDGKIADPIGDTATASTVRLVLCYIPRRGPESWRDDTPPKRGDMLRPVGGGNFKVTSVDATDESMFTLEARET